MFSATFWITEYRHEMKANLHAIQLDCAAEFSNNAGSVDVVGRFEMTRLATFEDQTRATLFDNIASPIWRWRSGY